LKIVAAFGFGRSQTIGYLKMNLEIENKVVAVVGGAGDIGSACAKQFLKEGALVIVGDRSEEKGSDLVESLKKDYPNRIHFLKLDLTHQGSIRDFVQSTVESHGGIDIIVNSAATFYFEELTQWEDSSELDRHIHVGLRGPITLIQEVWRLSERSRSGSIVNISSVAGHVGEPNALAYTPIKAAQKGLTKSLSIDMASQGGWSVSVSPGHCVTSVHKERARAEGKTWEEYVQTSPQVKTTMFDRFIEPEEVAKWVVIAASPLGKLATGQDLKISLGIESGGFNRNYDTSPDKGKSPEGESS